MSYQDPYLNYLGIDRLGWQSPLKMTPGCRPDAQRLFWLLPVVPVMSVCQPCVSRVAEAGMVDKLLE